MKKKNFKMNNIKKFEDFLDRMQGLLDNAKEQGHLIVRVEDLENTFPELKESEDERIRKELLNAFQESEDSLYMVLTPHRRESFIAWLEKQGEQKETLCDKCKKTQPSHSCQDITELGRCAVEHEQKSADKIEPKFHEGDWNEDDEYMLDETIQHLEELIRIDEVEHCGWNVQYYQRDIDWLKAIKLRMNND